MSKILELREKRAKAWDCAKAFLDSKRNDSGLCPRVQRQGRNVSIAVGTG